MCEPMTIMAASAMGLAVASGVTSMAADGQRRSSEVDYTNRLQRANKEQMDENRDLATQAYLDQAEAANRNLSETTQAAAEENFAQTRAAMKARSEVVTAAAETGVGGGASLEAMLADFHRQEGMFKMRNDLNLVFRQQQTASQVKGYRTEAVARTNSIKPMIAAPIQPVDYLGSALRIGGNIANAGMSMGKGPAAPSSSSPGPWASGYKAP